MVILLKKSTYFQLQTITCSATYYFNFSLRRQNQSYILVLFILVAFLLVLTEDARARKLSQMGSS